MNTNTRKLTLACTFTFEEGTPDEQAIENLQKEIPTAYEIIIETECSGCFKHDFQADDIKAYLDSFISKYDLKGECFDIKNKKGIIIFTEDNLTRN